jgi:hypothetical protein
MQDGGEPFEGLTANSAKVSTVAYQKGIWI